MIFIAEIGINHNGDLNNALKLIDIAKENGCNVVKFQKRNPDKSVPEHQKNNERIFLNEKMTYLEYKHKIEFSKQDYDIINKYCQDKNIQWTASVWDIDSVYFMEQYKENIPFLKIPSACITNIELLQAINKTQIPVILSNGMSTQEELDTALTYLDNVIGILHCNSSYPCAENEIDLNVMKQYQIRYPSLKIGYSGHEKDYFPTILAVTLGAEIIERHITLSNEMEGTDQFASLNPVNLSNLMKDIKRIFYILGEDKLHVYPSEEIIKKKLRSC